MNWHGQKTCLSSAEFRSFQHDIPALLLLCIFVVYILVFSPWGPEAAYNTNQQEKGGGCFRKQSRASDSSFFCWQIFFPTVGCTPSACTAGHTKTWAIQVLLNQEKVWKFQVCLAIPLYQISLGRVSHAFTGVRVCLSVFPRCESKLLERPVSYTQPPAQASAGDRAAYRKWG